MARPIYRNKLTGYLLHLVHLLLRQNGWEAFEEILQGGGNGVDSNIQVMDVLIGVFIDKTK